jgi:hypothetical protein
VWIARMLGWNPFSHHLMVFPNERFICSSEQETMSEQHKQRQRLISKLIMVNVEILWLSD